MSKPPSRNLLFLFIFLLLSLLIIILFFSLKQTSLNLIIQQNLDLLKLCDKKEQYYFTPVNVPTNGCGSQEDLSGSLLSQSSTPCGFYSCCDEHDRCYGTCLHRKDHCDLDFKRCMYRRAKNKGKECDLLAKVFYDAVDNLGKDAYKVAQNSTCYCVTEIPEGAKSKIIKITKGMNIFLTVYIVIKTNKKIWSTVEAGRNYIWDQEFEFEYNIDNDYIQIELWQCDYSFGCVCCKDDVPEIGYDFNGYDIPYNIPTYETKNHLECAWNGTIGELKKYSSFSCKYPIEMVEIPFIYFQIDNNQVSPSNNLVIPPQSIKVINGEYFQDPHWYNPWSGDDMFVVIKTRNRIWQTHEESNEGSPSFNETFYFAASTNDLITLQVWSCDNPFGCDPSSFVDLKKGLHFEGKVHDFERGIKAWKRINVFECEWRGTIVELSHYGGITCLTPSDAEVGGIIFFEVGGYPHSDKIIEV